MNNEDIIKTLEEFTKWGDKDKKKVIGSLSILAVMNLESALRLSPYHFSNREKIDGVPSIDPAPRVEDVKTAWCVFDSNNHKVAEFEYHQRREAVDLAEELTTSKDEQHFVHSLRVPVSEESHL